MDRFSVRTLLPHSLSRGRGGGRKFFAGVNRWFVEKRKPNWDKDRMK
jgi:hypothetical protein